MSERKSTSWFYPKPTGDPGRDRNARSVQFACLLFAAAIGLVAALDGGRQEVPLLLFAILGLAAAALMNRAGWAVWAARTTFLAVLYAAAVLVLIAHDGFRSHAMLIFPGLLLLTVMLLSHVLCDRRGDRPRDRNRHRDRRTSRFHPCHYPYAHRLRLHILRGSVPAGDRPHRQPGRPRHPEQRRQLARECRALLRHQPRADRSGGGPAHLGDQGSRGRAAAAYGQGCGPAGHL